MLVKFKSTATETVTMFGDIGKQLLQMMGASGKVPGALDATDVPEALRRLQAAVEDVKSLTHETAAPPAVNEDSAADDEDEDKPPTVSIATRAVPLISLLKRAAAAEAEVMWEAG
jgi:Domain of unknown function (DUF1840)